MAKYVYAIHKLHPLITHLELVQTNPPYTIMKFKTYEQNVTRKKKPLHQFEQSYQTPNEQYHRKLFHSRNQS